MDDEEVLVNKRILMQLVYWARRYCDGRSTYAPHDFNNIYKYIRSKHPDVVRCLDNHDRTLMDDGAYWPFAQDGMYNKETGQWDANK
jgi:hypothetical protein